MIMKGLSGSMSSQQEGLYKCGVQSNFEDRYFQKAVASSLETR